MNAKNDTIPAAPAHLGASGRRLWRDLTREFRFQPDALAVLRLACEQLDRADEARERLAKDGLLLDGRRHPATDVEKVAVGLHLRALRQLGLDRLVKGVK
jgi:phage terminase small subunit